MNITNDYQAGYCNIGAKEKRLRRRAGYFGAVLTLLGIIAFIFFRLDLIYSVLLFFPIYFAVIGFYQNKSNFCVYFGFSGLYDMEEDIRNIRKVQNEIKKKADRDKAIKLSLIAAIISGLITLGIAIIFYLIYTFFFV